MSFGHYISEPVNTSDPVVRNAALQSALADKADLSANDQTVGMEQLNLWDTGTDAYVSVVVVDGTLLLGDTSLKTLMGLNNVENSAASGLYVALTGTQTIAGAKTFSSAISTDVGVILGSLALLKYLSGSVVLRTHDDSAYRGLVCGAASINGTLTNAGNVTPDTTNTRTNGTSSSRWSNVYSALGDFSGAITVVGDIIQSTGGFTHRLNGNNSALQIIGAVDVNNGPSIQLRGNTNATNPGAIVFKRGTGSTSIDGFAIDSSGNPFPSSNNSLTNGTSTYRWANVYSVLGNFSGTVSVGVYTFATVPSASANTGSFIRISDRSQKHAYSDGTNWRFFDGSAIIS